MDESTQLQVFRELGSMDARIGNIEKDVGEIKDSQKAMAGQIAQLLESRAAQKASKGTILSIGGGSATLGGLIVAVGQWLGVGGQPERAPEPIPVRPTVSQPVLPTVDDTGNRQ